LFLDEIGNLSLNHQQKLLGVLQDIDGFWQYQVVGSSKTEKSDAFIIVATNADLEAKIKEGAFRADLYDRLNRESMFIPPLRERKCDIPLFFKLLSKEIPVSVDFENDLPRLDYDWPDNIRGLIHIIEKIEREKIINDDTSPICLDDLPELITQHQKKSKHIPTKGQQSGQRKRKYNKVTDEQIKEALRNSGNNKNQAAKVLGIDRKTIHNRTTKKSI
jgi:two-component system, NtrC family, response regulator HydG